MEKDTNIIIKAELERFGVKQWELADKLGMADTTLCRKLRKPVTDEFFNKAMQEIIRLGEVKNGK